MRRRARARRSGQRLAQATAQVMGQVMEEARCWPPPVRVPATAPALAAVLVPARPCYQTRPGPRWRRCRPAGAPSRSSRRRRLPNRHWRGVRRNPPAAESWCCAPPPVPGRFWHRRLSATHPPPPAAANRRPPAHGRRPPNSTGPRRIGAGPQAAALHVLRLRATRIGKAHRPRTAFFGDASAL